MKLSSPHIKSVYTFAVICALVSAILNSSSIPFKKLLLDGVDPIVGVVFLQLGVGFGMLLVNIIKTATTKKIAKKPEEKIQKSDYKIILLAVLFASAAAITLNFGLATSPASTASVLNNFEIVATALLALLIFKEKISKRLWIGIILITIGSITLSIKDLSSFSFTLGSILIILSCIAYGFRNNLMKVLSKRNPTMITMLIGFGSAVVTLILVLFMGSPFPEINKMLLLMLLGFVTSGMANVFMMLAQRHIGAAKTSAIRGIAPVLAVIISFLVFAQVPTFGFIASLVLVFPGLYFSITRNKETVAEERSESAEEDRNSFLASEKYEHARKYFTAFGCLIIAAIFGFAHLNYTNEYLALIQYTDELYNPADSLVIPVLIMSLLLLFCGVILLILRRRVLAAVSFIFLSVLVILSQILADYFVSKISIAIMSIVFALMLLTAKGRQKYIFALVNFLVGVTMIAFLFASYSVGFIIQAVVSSIAIIFLVYISIASVSERKNLPLKELLCTYEKTDFKTCVPVLGYLFIVIFETENVVFTMTSLSNTITPLTNTAYFTALILAGMLILIGTLILFIGKLGFISVMFIGFGFCIWALTATNVLTMYCIAMIFLVLGVFALCQSYSNLMRSLLLIFSGIICLLYPMLWNYPEIFPAVIGMALLTIALALYMAISSISDKPKLPVF